MALASMTVPVPCRPGADGQLRIEPKALLGFEYREEMLSAPPNRAHVCVFAPSDLWVPDVAPGSWQPFDLGLVPASIPLREIVLLVWETLGLRNWHGRDPWHCMNPEAAQWWRAHPDLAPLTHATLLDPTD